MLRAPSFTFALLSLLLFIPLFAQSQAQEQICILDVVFILDTSASMDSAVLALCEVVSDVVRQVENADINLQVTLLGTGEDIRRNFDCLQGIDPDLEIFLGNLATYLELPEDFDEYPCLADGGEIESWASHSAIICERFPWREEAGRVVAPMADEPPCGGLPCDGNEENGTVYRAVNALNEGNCSAYPIFPAEPGMLEADCILPLADQLAEQTNGTFALLSNRSNSGLLAEEVREAFLQIALQHCQIPSLPPTTLPPTTSPPTTDAPTSSSPTEPPSSPLSPTAPLPIFIVIGDFIWNDLNFNGIQNDGEPGIEGVSVYLTDLNLNIIRNTTTNENGQYFFQVLPLSSYFVMIPLTSENPMIENAMLSPRAAGMNRDIDSNGELVVDFVIISVTTGVANNFTFDAGFFMVGVPTTTPPTTPPPTTSPPVTSPPTTSPPTTPPPTTSPPVTSPPTTSPPTTSAPVTLPPTTTPPTTSSPVTLPPTIPPTPIPSPATPSTPTAPTAPPAPAPSPKMEPPVVCHEGEGCSCDKEDAIAIAIAEALFYAEKECHTIPGNEDCPKGAVLALPEHADCKISVDMVCTAYLCGKSDYYYKVKAKCVAACAICRCEVVEE